MRLCVRVFEHFWLKSSIIKFENCGRYLATAFFVFKENNSFLREQKLNLQERKKCNSFKIYQKYCK